jgi:RNA polymerase sigma factor FliA
MEPPLTVAQHKRVRQALPIVEEEAAKLKRRYGASVDLGDLMSIGKLALYGCVRRFEPGPKRSFEGYARFRVRGAMHDDIRCATRQARIRREMARMGSNRMADYHDDYDILRHDRDEHQRRADLMTEHHATAMWLGGAMQARREAEHDPEAAAEYASIRARLELVLEPLSDDERKLLDLVFASWFKIDEAADALGVVRETAGRRLRRLLDRLRRQLIALGVTEAPEPMNHPGVRPFFVVRFASSEDGPHAAASNDEGRHVREPDDDAPE